MPTPVECRDSPSLTHQALTIANLGRVPYADAHALQKRLHAEVADDAGNGLYLAREAACNLPGGVMTIESGAAWVRVRHNGKHDQQLYQSSWPATRVSFMFSL